MVCDQELAGTVLTSEGAAEVEKAVERCDEWTNLAELTDLFRRYSRS